MRLAICRSLSNLYMHQRCFNAHINQLHFALFNFLHALTISLTALFPQSVKSSFTSLLSIWVWLNFVCEYPLRMFDPQKEIQCGTKLLHIHINFRSTRNSFKECGLSNFYWLVIISFFLLLLTKFGICKFLSKIWSIRYFF